MGFLTGSIALSRYKIVEPVPDAFWPRALEKLKEHGFRDIDNSSEERSIGWVCFDDMLDSAWQAAPPEKGEYLTFSLRMDTRRIAPAVFKKHYQLALREMQSRMRDQGQKFVTRDQKKDLRDIVAQKLRAKTLPVPAYFEVVWSMRNSRVCLGSTRDAVRQIFEDLFERSFGLHLEPLNPFYLALRDGRDPKVLEKIEPTALGLG